MRLDSFFDIEKERLSAVMLQKEITVCQDETFHPETCRVAIEPDSNFILLEKYTNSRKASEWTESMEEATQGLLITVVQSTIDEGKGILHHVKSDLGVLRSTPWVAITFLFSVLFWSFKYFVTGLSVIAPHGMSFFTCDNPGTIPPHVSDWA